MKEWYNIDLDMDYLKKHFIKCDKLHGTIYYNKKRGYDKYNLTIFRYNREVAKKYLNIYAKNIDNILDIGIGKGNAIPDYVNTGIKNIVGIEPSIYSIENSRNILLKYKNHNINIIQGFGDVKWNNKSILNKTYKVIILTFTIHYMIKNLDILIENINKVTESGSFVIIFCLDGQKIFNRIDKKKKRYEIMFKKEPYWGIYEYNDDLPNKFDKDFQMLFYMKDVYGVSNGSEEYLVNSERLINSFKNFKLVLRKSFLDDLKTIPSFKNKINLDFQKEILSIHQTIILQKN
jgi:hypothetical protein